GYRADAPSKILEKIEGRRVRPVNVLENQHRRALAVLQLAQKRAEDRKPAVCRLHEVEQGAVHLECDVMQWSQRLRSRERIATREQHTQLGAIGGKESFDEGGLADAGFAMHERDMAATRGCFAKSVSERLQRCGTFKQVGEITGVVD